MVANPLAGDSATRPLRPPPPPPLSSGRPRAACSGPGCGRHGNGVHGHPGGPELVRAPAARATQRRQDCGRGGPGSCNPGYPGAGKDPTSPCDPGAAGDAGAGSGHLAAGGPAPVYLYPTCLLTSPAHAQGTPWGRDATSRNSTGMVPAYAQQPHIRCSAKFHFCLLRKISNLLPPCSIPHSIPHSIDNGKSWWDEPNHTCFERIFCSAARS